MCNYTLVCSLYVMVYLIDVRKKNALLIHGLHSSHAVNSWEWRLEMKAHVHSTLNSPFLFDNPHRP